jgi:hypothetical protein
VDTLLKSIPELILASPLAVKLLAPMVILSAALMLAPQNQLSLQMGYLNYDK